MAKLMINPKIDNVRMINLIFGVNFRKDFCSDESLAAL
jgi:hypothetical protein